MLSVDKALLDDLTGVFYHLLRDGAPEPLPIPAGLPDNELRQLITYINRFLVEYTGFVAALRALADGDLDARAPAGRSAVVLAYKALQSNLRHLTWKTQRIAAGHLDERVDFLGELSAAFNSMSAQLRDSFRAIEESNRELAEANEQIRTEKEHSERLLLNILPASVADELKRSGHSEPQLFEQATVLFSDIVGFTRISTEIAPRRLIDDLNSLFTRFDEIMEEHGCERIKTIGDAYLGVCGMPRPNPDHARLLVAAAVNLLEWLKEQGVNGWQVRIGIHSGPLVGGIVGVHKYIYDVFGDTINTASRMETLSEPMRINLSEVTWHQVRDVFPCTPRAVTEVKGKGRMRMFFLDV